MLDTKRMMLTRSDFSVRVVHMNNGWRHWAFCNRRDAHVDNDTHYGLRADGYDSRAEAEQAIALAIKAVR